MSRARAAEQGGRTVMLTMRNAVDQTRKVAIEAPQGSTVREAAIEAGIAQGESFDVFTAEGVSVTREPVEDHAEAVLQPGEEEQRPGDGGRPLHRAEAPLDEGGAREDGEEVEVAEEQQHEKGVARMP